jgi:chromosome segregation ATPase
MTIINRTYANNLVNINIFYDNNLNPTGFATYDYSIGYGDIVKNIDLIKGISYYIKNGKKIFGKYGEYTNNYRMPIIKNIVYDTNNYTIDFPELANYKIFKKYDYDNPTNQPIDIAYNNIVDNKLLYLYFADAKYNDPNYNLSNDNDSLARLQYNYGMYRFSWGADSVYKPSPDVTFPNVEGRYAPEYATKILRKFTDVFDEDKIGACVPNKYSFIFNDTQGINVVDEFFNSNCPNVDNQTELKCDNGVAATFYGSADTSINKLCLKCGDVDKGCVGVDKGTPFEFKGPVNNLTYTNIGWTDNNTKYINELARFMGKGKTIGVTMDKGEDLTLYKGRFLSKFEKTASCPKGVNGFRIKLAKTSDGIDVLTNFEPICTDVLYQDLANQKATEFATQLAECVRNNQTLTNDKETLTSQISNLNNQIAILTQQNNNLNIQITELNKQIAKLNEIQTVLSNNGFEDIQSVFVLLNTTSNAANENLDLVYNLNNQITDLNSQIATLNASKQDLINQNTNKDATITSLNEQIISLTEQKTQLINELGTAKTLLYNLQNINNGLAQDNSSFSKEIERLNQTISDLTQQLNLSIDDNNKLIQDKLTLQNTVSDLTNQLLQITNDKQTLENTLNETSRKLAESVELQKMTETEKIELAKSLASSIELHNMTKAEKEEISVELATALELQRLSKIEKEKLLKDLSDALEKNNDLENIKTQLEKKLEEANNANSILESVKNEISSQLDQVKLYQEQLKIYNKNLVTEIFNVIREKNTLSYENTSLNKKIADLEKQRLDLETQRLDLETQKLDLEKKYNNLLKQLDNVNKAKELIDISKADLEKQLEEVKRQLSNTSRFLYILLIVLVIIIIMYMKNYFSIQKNILDKTDSLVRV